MPPASPTLAQTNAPGLSATPVASPVGTTTVQVIATKLLEPSGITMVYVPAGEFLMGCADSDPLAHNDEKPQHHVYLDGYWIGQTEVTNAQYRRFIEAGGYGTQTYWSNSGWAWKESTGVTQPEYWSVSKWNGAEDPVVGVSWYEAEAYAKWAGARLPTEAEWEYAARGGPLSLGYEYAGSNSVDEVAWYYGNSYGNSGRGTHPVARKKANELGLYDMSGNAWEWVADWYDYGYYGSSPRENPSGPLNGDDRVERGGSWTEQERYVRCAFRFRYSSFARSDEGGFRVAQ
jgi:formylglycine-generating enzyme required for sulfatase activity